MAMPMEKGEKHWQNKYSLPVITAVYPDKFICSHYKPFSANGLAT
jgi:hypothetical protein